LREALFIFAVVLVLLGLTAVKYRRQIAQIIGFAKMLTGAAAQNASLQPSGGSKQSVHLVNCSGCSVWVPADKAILKSGSTLCVRCAEIGID